MVHLEDDELEDIPRTAEEIARRSLVLSAVITAVYGSPPIEILNWLEREGLTGEISPHERKFLIGRSPESAKIYFSWKVESLLILLWSICKIDKLPTLAEKCDTEAMKKAIIFPPGSTKGYISSATLRDIDEIFLEREKVFEAHWTVRDAQLNDRDIPRELNPEIIYERHYAFNWVLGYMRQPWDEITTDT